MAMWFEVGVIMGAARMLALALAFVFTIAIGRILFGIFCSRD